MGVDRRLFLVGFLFGLLPARLLGQPEGESSAGRAKALVVSFGYHDTPRNFLPNTLADGRLIVETMQRLGFGSVTTVSDGPPDTVLAQIGTFVDGLTAEDVAILYFAGHGVQVANENLLILPGAERFLSLRSLIESVRARTNMVVFFLDACRNNPFEQVPTGAQVSRALATRAAEANFETVALAELVGARGAAPSSLRPFSLRGSGVRIIFSTDPNNVALDGATPSSVNSPFATALARRMLERRSLDDVVSLTTGDVLTSTTGRQSPWSQGSINRPIFLAGPPLRRNPARPPFQIPG